jgi:hypothetical protein
MKRGARVVAPSLALWLALGAAGCATTPAPPSGTVTSPMPGHAPEPVKGTDTSTGAIPTPPPVAPPIQVGTTASGGTIVQTGSPSDSGPSADAQAVLNTIPDPVAGSEAGQQAPAATGSGAVSTGPAATTGGAGAAGAAAGAAGVAAAVRPDSTQADTSTVATADSSSMPTPAPTEPLGEHPGAHAVTDGAAVVAAPGTGTAQASPPGAAPANPAPAGPCWRVQVAAVPEQARAKALRDAAQSQLMTDMVIEVEKKLYKVRTKECLSTEAADRIRQHAIDDGFPGAFRFKPTK